MADDKIVPEFETSRDEVQALLNEGTPQFRRLESLIYEFGDAEMQDLITEIHVKLGRAALVEGYSVPPAAEGEIHPVALTALQAKPNSGGGGK